MQSKLPDKLYYSIGEVASAFEVNTSLIRFWEKEFDILKPKKNAKGDRKFSKEDVANLELIYHLVKVQGFTLDGAKIRLKENKQKVLSRLELIKKLEWVKVELQKIKNELKNFNTYEKMEASYCYCRFNFNCGRMVCICQ